MVCGGAGLPGVAGAPGPGPGPGGLNFSGVEAVVSHACQLSVDKADFGYTFRILSGVSVNSDSEGGDVSIHFAPFVTWMGVAKLQAATDSWMKKFFKALSGFKEFSSKFSASCSDLVEVVPKLKFADENLRKAVL